jgi:hypothetical protein
MDYDRRKKLEDLISKYRMLKAGWQELNPTDYEELVELLLEERLISKRAVQTLVQGARPIRADWD